ncbi:longitudinals lacking protein, isoforms H/M/V-like isoform X2 [Fopius arisanus]|uniref:Longitudinals lacking protein, isoforms H/M/V-like isoform X2 n=1 Tax=Fopius arisanus TaxID=64838 RepID=A0A9R1TD37_9HYME|nr:PREDICTED: longitudinals lacking protein, isoforms H/M/V-like isoform X2 [Fopius arisanus]
MTRTTMALTDSFPSSEQFALRWNNFSHNLSSGFLTHLNNQDLVDVTIAVEGQILQAHKLVLSVCSTYFQNIFKANPCQHPVVILKDMGYTEVDALLKFMYQGEVNVKQEELASFLKVAETLQVKGLTLDKQSLKHLPRDNGSVSEHSNGVPKIESDFENSGLPGDHVKSIKQDRVPKKRLLQTSNSTNSFKRTRSSGLTAQNSSDQTSTRSASPKNDGPSDDDKHETDDTYQDLTNTVENDINKNVNDSIDLTKDDNFGDLDELIPTNTSAKTGGEGNVEPVTYRLSARGRPQLVHEGYVYNLTSRSEVLNRSHYRCAEQHRGCRGKCAVIAERFMPTGVHEHNHAPGYQSEQEYRKKKASEGD